MSDYPPLKLSTGMPGAPIPPLDDDKPKIIILPGTFVTQELSPPKLPVAESMLARGMIKTVKASLKRSGLSENDVTVVSAIYSHQDETPYLREHFPEALLRNTDPNIEHISKDAFDIVDQALLPIMGAANGAKPDIATACAKLSKVTFYCHSYGTLFAPEVAKAFRMRLTERGYTEQEINRLCHEVTTISIGNGAALEHEKPVFRTFSFGAMVDLSVYKTMQRVGAEFTTRFPRTIPTVDAVYRRAGFDPGLARQRYANGGETYCHTPIKHDLERPRLTRDGVLILGDMPGELRWVPENGKPGAEEKLVNRTSLSADCTRLEDTLKAVGESTISRSGTPLIRDDVTPEHSVQMFTVPTDSGNRKMVEQVDTVLANAVARDVSQPSRFREETTAMLNGHKRQVGG